MTLRILACAEEEMAEAVDFYNERRPGLGCEFAAEVERAFEHIEAFPDAWPPFSERSRRFIVNRFPYGVLPGGGRADTGPRSHASAFASRRWQDRLRPAP